jgi:hypothetical protein
MVGTEPVEVERRLRAGGLVCGCGGRLRPRGMPGGARCVGWGRCVRVGSGAGRAGSRHVLLAVSCLLRRADSAEVIGAAVTARAVGTGHRRIAARLGRLPSTVRGWLRALMRNVERVRALFTALLVELDPLVGALPVLGCGFADAVAGIGAAAAAARRRLGVVGAVSAWQLASAVSGGRLLAPAGPVDSINTSWPWATG